MKVLSHSPLALKGTVSSTGWQLPSAMTEVEWYESGLILGNVQRSVSWWIGDWWLFGELRYGERKATTEADDWAGPSFQTCRNAASICRRFPTSRRRDVLPFEHHAEVAYLPPNEADELLDWAERSIALTGKPRSTRELRAEVSRRRSRGLFGAQSSSLCAVDDLNALVSTGIRFGCIYADPPWRYDNQGTRASTGDHYQATDTNPAAGMSIEQICALPVRDLVAPDAHLHMWITNAFLFDAPRIFNEWGFEFRSSLIWVKPQIGIGNYWRNSHEFLLTAIRGNAKRFADKSLRSWIECDRGQHSAKPEQVRAMLERASPGPYLELFGRRIADGWVTWGNQIERSLFTAALENAA